MSDEINELKDASARLIELQYWIGGFLSRASQDPWTGERTPLSQDHYEAVIQAQNYIFLYERKLEENKQKD